MPVNPFVAVERINGNEAKELQERIRAWTGQIKDISAGLLVEDKVIGTSETEVGHGLGRVPLGRIVVAQDAAATIHDTKAADKTFLYLQASAETTVTVWVF